MIQASLFAQIKLKANQMEGYVISSESSRKEVIIEVEDINFPWAFQQNVKYYDKSLLAGGRVKREDKKLCVPGVIVEFGTQKRKFIFVNHSAKVSSNKNKLNAAISKFKEDENTDFFSEVIHDGKIQLLKFYNIPEISDADYDNEAIIQTCINDSNEKFDILLAKKGFSPKSVSDLNFNKFFDECPAVLNKFEHGEYVIKPSKGLKAFFGKEGLSGLKLEMAVNEIIQDYEENCGK